jgi:hypothetical protein
MATSKLTIHHNLFRYGIEKMADFYPLILNAVGALKVNANAERQALYDRMRDALSAALRTTEPPFTEIQIMRERLALEDAVRKVEEGLASKVPLMVVSGMALGRFNPVWRVPSRTLHPPSRSKS